MRTAQPKFLRAVLADARVAAANQGDPLPPGGRGRTLLAALRLAYKTDAFAAHALYRAEARTRSLGVPLLPRLLRRLTILTAQVQIGPDAVVRPGVYIAHGQIIIRGATEIGTEAVLSPFAEIGPTPGDPDSDAPTIAARARIGTGARILGKVSVGEGARIGANALVLESVPADATAVGVPARILPAKRG